MNLFVRVRKDVRIFVEDTRTTSEHVVLFIHSLPFNHNMWEYQVEFLMELNYRCITVDLRGFGRSDRPFDEYDYDTMASDIKTVIDALGVKDITLVGHSMGAAIAIRYMSKYDGYNVSKLVLLSSAAPSFVQTDDWKYGLTPDQVGELIQLTYVNRPKLITVLRDMMFYRYATEEVNQWFNLMCLEASGWGTGKSLESLHDERLFNDLPKVKVPTLIVHSIHDYVCPFQLATYLNDHIKDSTLLKLDQSGHATFFEEKDKVSDAMHRFMRGKLNIPKTPEDII